MKRNTEWSHKPYLPVLREKERKCPYICRIIPSETTVQVDWFDSGCDGVHTVSYQKITEAEWTRVPAESNRVILEGMEPEQDYRVVLEAENGKKSLVRLVRTGFVPGTVVNYLHPQDEQYRYSGQFTCSPSLVRLPDGALLASHDVYGSGAAQNLTVLLRSEDNGVTWKYLSELFPCYWGTLFVWKEEVYLFALSTEFGDLLIGKSSDGGYTWSKPTVLGRGSCHCGQNGFQKAPYRPVEYNGRIWLVIEYGSWAQREFGYLPLSAPVDADLLLEESWTLGDVLVADSEQWGLGHSFGMETSVLVKPDGSGICGLMRCGEGFGIRVQIDAENPDAPLQFDGLYPFAMAHSKAEIQRRPEDGLYIAVGNRLPLRNIASIYTSKDLERWDFWCDILNYEHLPKEDVGFQYPSSLIEGETMRVLLRTAFNKADNFHNANYITYHEVQLPPITKTAE